jgi:hypothetical protein
MIKTLYTLLYALLLWQQADEKVTYEIIKEASFVKVLNNIRLLDEFETNELSIRIWEIRDKPSSAKRASGEANSILYLAVSEFGEYPEQQLFRLASIYAPHVESVTKSNNPVIRISYVDEKGKKHFFKVVVSLDKLIIQKD